MCADGESRQLSPGEMPHQPPHLCKGHLPKGVRRLLCCMSAFLLCWLLARTEPLLAQGSTLEYGPTVTVRIGYEMPEAGKVFLVWGTDDWSPVPVQTSRIGRSDRAGTIRAVRQRQKRSTLHESRWFSRS